MQPRGMTTPSTLTGYTDAQLAEWLDQVRQIAAMRAAEAIAGVDKLPSGSTWARFSRRGPSIQKLSHQIAVLSQTRLHATVACTRNRVARYRLWAGTGAKRRYASRRRIL